ncbi:MAG TPA: hypothetical protein VF329_05865 [Gammaproteobacteria bacterium]
MRKSKSGAGDEFNDLPFFTGDDDGDLEDFYLDQEGLDPETQASRRRLPARQRVELRNEQRTLREQLSDWDDYDNEDFEDFDTRL